MIKLSNFQSRSCTPLFRWGIVACIVFGIICPVYAADASIEADLGDTLTLHGSSFTGSSVYLFMTRPGLPANGVALNNVTQPGAQGSFTQVDLDKNQQWLYRWDTSLLGSRFKTGTYLVYVTTEPVDKAHLGGESTYKTLEVYLKDSGASQIVVSSGPSYTLNPEMHSSVAAPGLNLTTSTPSPTPLPTTAAPVLTPSPVPLPTTKSPLGLPATLLAVSPGYGVPPPPETEVTPPLFLPRRYYHHLCIW